jgi:hypothetical protein
MLLTPGHRAWWSGKGHPMSNGLQRAQFTFGSESEVRYITAPPALGAYVTHGGELWRVSSTDMDELGLKVVCQRRRMPVADESDADL